MADSAPTSVLAIDVGGTKLAAAVADLSGGLHGAVRTPTIRDADPEALYSQVVALARNALAGAASTAVAPPTVVGVGCGGPSRQMNRLVSPLNIPAWRDFPLADRLSVDLDLEVHCHNDAKALTLAEGWLGAARGVDNYLGMVVSTGVGAGIVLRGRLLEGADGNAGHLGQVIVEPGGHADAAGIPGSLEGMASGTGIEAITGRRAVDADDERRRLTGVMVGRAVASVANLLDLQLAVVAGSVALGYGDTFFEAAQATLDEHCRVLHSMGAVIRPAGLGAEGPLLGAAAVALVGEGVDVLALGRASGGRGD